MATVLLERYINVLTEKHIVFTILITSIMFLIFVTDLQYTTELYIGVLYLIVVMLSLWLPSATYTFFFAIFSTVLAAFGYFYSIYNISPMTYMYQPNFINLSMTLAAIWITTIIAIYIKGITISLKKHEIIHSAILDASIDPILMISKQGIIETASKTIARTFGWTAEEIVGKSFDSILTHQYKDKYNSIIIQQDNIVDSTLLGNTQEAICINRMHREFPCEISLNYIEIPELEESFFTAVLRDISIRKSYEQKLGWLSSHDDLTKIYNRRYFNIQIDKEWRRMLRSREPLALIILDIDYFKSYNDSLGHQIGDQCLIKIASCLQDSSRRAGDVVARYGGEEFVLLLPATDLDGAKTVGENIQRCISNLNIPHPNSQTSKKITVSLGIAAMIPLRGCSYERLIRFADQALYTAKQNGRNKFCVYQD
jgi:diguanylate cyclase (GGDEF)-like protein/PAS domain S-box-containing protein